MSTSVQARQLLTSTQGVQDKAGSFPLHTHPHPCSSLAISSPKIPRKQAEPSGQALVGEIKETRAAGVAGLAPSLSVGTVGFPV